MEARYGNGVDLSIATDTAVGAVRAIADTAASTTIQAFTYDGNRLGNVGCYESR